MKTIMSNTCFRQMNLSIVNALNDFGVKLDDDSLLNQEELSQLNNLTELLEMMLLDLSLDSGMRQQIGVVLSLHRKPQYFI